MRVVRAGEAPGPTVVLEAGSFGSAADYGALQPLLAAGMRTFAYDRAGLGFSDPGPRPRDARAVTSDLARLLQAAGETPPFLLVGHSMAALHVCAFAKLRPRDVVGLVLLDALPPEVLSSRLVRSGVEGYRRLSGLAPLAARLFLNAASSPVLGDRIDVPEPAKSEKRRFFASPEHNYWAAQEVREWLRSSEYVRDLGELDRDLPVAVVTAGRGLERLKALQAEPAHRSRSGYAVNVAGADHASLLGRRHAPAVARAVEFVRTAAL